MKKILLLVLAVTVVGTLAFGQTTQVLSRNAVGYIKLDVRSNGLTLASIPFNAFSNTVQGIMGDQMVGNAFPANADQLLKWDISGQRYITIYKNGSGIWCYSSNAAPASDSYLMPGEGFWLRSKRTTNQTVYLMGEVPDSRTAPTSTVSGLVGLNAISYAYPVSQPITNLTALFALATKNVFPASADQLLSWNKETQTYRTYYAHTAGWRNTTNASVNTSDIVNPGDGLWFRRRAAGGAFAWTELKPYTWP